MDRDHQLDVTDPAEVRRLLRRKNRHNVLTILMFLLSRWILTSAITVLTLDGRRPALGARTAGRAGGRPSCSPLSTGYLILIDRLVRRMMVHRPDGCSIYDRAFWRHERFWKLGADRFPQLFNGTPMKNVVWRMLGAKIGKRVFDDGCTFTERRFVTIGDRCTLNAGSIVQCHSQEDGAFKSDRSSIGAGTTLGVGAFVHYGVQIGDGVRLEADSFLMKGSEVPSGSRWGGNPAMELEAPRGSPLPVRHHASHTGRAPADCPRGPFVRSEGESMQNPAADDREYWTRVLAAGGTTAVPRWVTDPAPGVGEHVAPIPTELQAAVDGARCSLTAHAAVLAALSGEADVVTGYVPAGRQRPLPCPLSAGPATWRELLDRTRDAERELLAHADFPVEAARAPKPCSAAPTCPPTPSLGVVAPTDGRPALRVRYRRDALDAEAAARIAGYHLTALHRIVTEPDAASDEHSLLSAEEVAFQIDGLAGPHRELPDRRFHELFEQRVRTHPDAVAAECAATGSWTYRELNARANRIGHALARPRPGPRGRGRGGHRAQPRLDGRRSSRSSRPAASTSRSSRTCPPTGSPACCAAPSARSCSPSRAARPPSTRRCSRRRRCSGSSSRTPTPRTTPTTTSASPVGPDQLAYIYFTSGSTGEPKGAMCEHAGHAQPPPRQDRRPGDRRGPDRRRRPRRSASTSRSGSWSRRCWSAAAR